MHCRTLVLPDGGAAIICGSRGRRHRCRCGAWATRQCDFALKGKKSGKTCDAHICERCATKGGDDVDFCPPHAALVKASTQQGLDPSLFRESL